MRHKREIINKVERKIREENSLSVDRNSLYSRGLSSEGYAGGYLQALRDVDLLFSGNVPNFRYENIWKEVIREMEAK